MVPFLALLLVVSDPPGTPDPAVTAAPKPAPTEHLRKIVVEAIRNCPESKGDEIVVCSRDRGLAEGYRLPRLDPRYAQAAAPRGDITVGTGAAGIGSCSGNGAGGATGCTRAAIGDWAAEREARRSAERLIP